MSAIHWKIVDCWANSPSLCEFKTDETDGIASINACPGDGLSDVEICLRSNEIESIFPEADEPSLVFNLRDVLLDAFRCLQFHKVSAINDPDVDELAEALHALVEEARLAYRSTPPPNAVADQPTPA